MTRQVGLLVNDVAIELDYFVSAFIEHVISGVLRGLRGTGEIGHLELSMDEGRQVTINLNNTLVPINPFVNKIIGNTITGMVSSLKGVSEIKKLKMTIAH